MNHNAYTVVAIEGTHFCDAAKTVCFRECIKKFIKKYKLPLKKDYRYNCNLKEKEKKYKKYILLSVY